MLHETASCFETNFSDTLGFSVFHLVNPQDITTEENERFSVLLDIIDQKHEYFTNVVGMYKSGVLTIGALAILLRKNPIEAWSLLVNAPDIGVRSTTGEAHTFAEARKVLTTDHCQLVADISSLMTFHRLGIAQDVVEVFGSIAITQSTLDQFTGAMNSMRGVSEKGFTAVGKEGKVYVKEDITAEQIRQSTHYLQTIVDWIRKECDIIPCEETLHINARQRQKWYAFFDPDAIDAILLAKQERRILVSEDEQLRQMARKFYGVDGAWTQPVLEHMLIKGKISKASYQRSIISLILSNYHHTSINADTLEEAAKQSSWKPDRRFEKVALMLSGEHSDDISALNIGVDFTYRLYTQQIFLSDPDPLLFTILDLVFKSRGQRTLLLTQFIRAVQEKFFGYPQKCVG